MLFRSGIELAIVVLGVFIGLQVSNWNESRVEQARTTLVLDAFRADMRECIPVQQTFPAYINAVSHLHASAYVVISATFAARAI